MSVEERRPVMVHDLAPVQEPAESKYPWTYYTMFSRISGQNAFGPPGPACQMGKWAVPP
jgi:branched-chain amino acid transport system substrate-binding protein